MNLFLAGIRSKINDNKKCFRLYQGLEWIVGRLKKTWRTLWESFISLMKYPKCKICFWAKLVLVTHFDSYTKEENSMGCRISFIDFNLLVWSSKCIRFYCRSHLKNGGRVCSTTTNYPGCLCNQRKVLILFLWHNKPQLVQYRDKKRMKTSRNVQSKYTKRENIKRVLKRKIIIFCVHIQDVYV